MNRLACRFCPHSHLPPTDAVCELTKFSWFSSVVRIAEVWQLASTAYGSGSFLVLSVFSCHDTVCFTLDFSNIFVFMKSISFETRLKISQLKKLSVYWVSKLHGAGTWDAFLHMTRMILRRRRYQFCCRLNVYCKKCWNKKYKAKCKFKD